MAKSKELQKVLSEINETNSEKHEVIPTGIYGLDFILGGGIELGSKVQIVAESSVGKSTIALQIAKLFCNQKYNVLYVDTENSITEEMLKSTQCSCFYNCEDNKLGEFVLLKESDFNTVSKKLDICLKSKYFKLIVIDSLASLVSNCYVDIDSSKKEVKEVTNNNTNYESRPLNLFINKYSCLANRYNTAILYVNQYRNKIDPVKGTILKEFGNKIVRYNSDIIIKIKKDKTVLWQDENRMFSNDASANAKNPPTHTKLVLTLDKSNKQMTGTTVETYLKYGFGIDKELDQVLDEIRLNEIQQKGKYYIFPGEEKQHEGFLNLVNHIMMNYVK